MKGTYGRARRRRNESANPVLGLALLAVAGIFVVVPAMLVLATSPAALWTIIIAVLIVAGIIVVVRDIKRRRHSELAPVAVSEILPVRDSRYIPTWMRQHIMQRDQGQCVQCGSRSYLEFDHIIPLSRGGATSANNLQLLCRRCNLSKHNS